MSIYLCFQESYNGKKSRYCDQQLPAKKFMFNGKKSPRQNVRNVRTYGGYRKPQYQAPVVPKPAQPELTIPPTGIHTK